MQIALTNKIMQCHASKNNMLLSTSGETWHVLQNTSLLLQHSESPLNDISKGWMQKIENLILPFRRTPRTKPEFWYVVCASFERGKISYSVWITRVHKIIFSYKTKSNHQRKTTIELLLTLNQQCIPLGGTGNEGKFANAWLRIRVSCVEPGQPTTAKINLISKSQTASTFWDVYPCRHVWLTTSSAGTATLTCEPSIAPIAPLK